VSLIREFVDSWPLFGATYVAAWLIAAGLGLMGVLVVARDQVFVGAAVAQATTLGIAAGMLFAPEEGHGPAWVRGAVLSGAAVLFAIGASLVTSRAGSVLRESREAVTGWVFLFSSSVAVLILAQSPHGTEEVHHLVSSSIILATQIDVVVFAGVAFITALAVALWHRKLLLWVMDPTTAAAVGVRTHLIETVSAVWLGLVLGLAIRASGTLYTFGCLVLPALVAKRLCREVGSMLWVAPVVGLMAAVAAFVIGNHYDQLPQAQLTVAGLCALVALGWAYRRFAGR
jgi:ABC-type Mn2+/Zn2+ transport system permease subunit